MIDWDAIDTYVETELERQGSGSDQDSHSGPP